MSGTVQAPKSKQAVTNAAALSPRPQERFVTFRFCESFYVGLLRLNNHVQFTVTSQCRVIKSWRIVNIKQISRLQLFTL